MVQLIVGEKGKGKTKFLLDKANEAVKSAEGNIVYIDKSGKHMYDLSNKVRLIDASRYPLQTGDEFIGFICGIISQDHDLQQIYLDSFLKNAKIEDNVQQFTEYVKQLSAISEQFKVDFVLSVSKNEKELEEAVRENIIVSL